jgi:hypothetical protein
MTTVAPSAAPPHAIKVWADHMNVYAEIPSLNQPCILAFRLSEGGLSQILSLLGAKHGQDAAGVPYLRPPVLTKKQISEGITTLDLDAARHALLDLGLLK